MDVVILVFYVTNFSSFWMEFIDLLSVHIGDKGYVKPSKTCSYPLNGRTYYLLAGYSLFTEKKLRF